MSKEDARSERIRCTTKEFLLAPFLAYFIFSISLMSHPLDEYWTRVFESVNFGEHFWIVSHSGVNSVIPSSNYVPVPTHLFLGSDQNVPSRRPSNCEIRRLLAISRFITNDPREISMMMGDLLNVIWSLQMKTNTPSHAILPQSRTFYLLTR